MNKTLDGEGLASTLHQKLNHNSLLKESMIRQY